MNTMTHEDFNKYRYDGSILDLHTMFKDFTELTDVQDGEWAFIDMYFSNIAKVQRINSRQVAALAMTNIEALVCLNRSLVAIIVQGDATE